MSRFQFGLMLFALGFGLAFVSSSVTKEREPAWDPEEAGSPLLTQQESPPVGKDFHVDTRATSVRWGRTASRARVRPASFQPGQAFGVVTRLQSPDVVISAISPSVGFGPDGIQPVCFASATTTNPAYNAACSTGAKDSKNCSVNSDNTGTCSTINNSDPPSCSAGNSGNNSGSSPCSTLNSNHAQCSTLATSNNAECSTDSDNLQENQGCSVAAGANNTNDTCSALAGAEDSACSTNGSSGGNTCSVLGSTDGSNQCSATSGTTDTFCSVNSGQGEGDPKDFCSVTPGAGQKGMCTVTGDNPGGNAKCSVQTDGNGVPYNGGSCSVKGQPYTPGTNCTL